MSTGLECEIIEAEPGRWFYVLQDGSCPVECWDWHEFAHAYGPFETYGQATEHLRRFHANPGGHWRKPYEQGYEPGETLARLFKEATR